jgi:cytosine/creatinine deaminase
MMGLPERGVIRPGTPADLIPFRGRDWRELVSRPQTGRTVLRAGRRIDTTLPDSRELDRMFGSAGRA